MVKKIRAVLDTNIIVSALVFGGKPEDVLILTLQKDILAVTSPSLITELDETLIKKFDYSKKRIQQVERKIRKSFRIVNPTQEIHIQQDEDDNRVLEAAVEGKCNYIITGDKELLDLGAYKGIKIVTATQFLSILE